MIPWVHLDTGAVPGGESTLRLMQRGDEFCIVVGSIELMKGLAARGLGIAFQTRLGLEREMRDGVLVHVPLRVPARMNAELGVFVRAARMLPPALDAFIDIVTEEIRRREAEEV